MPRERLAHRRRSEVLEFDHDGIIRYRASESRFPDGALAEVFMDGGKPDTVAAINARDLAVAASLALQHGCPAETIRSALTRLHDGRAAGPLGTALDKLAEG